MDIIVVHNSFWGLEGKTDGENKSWAIFREQMKGLRNVGLTKGATRIISTGSCCSGAEQNRIRDWLNNNSLSKVEMKNFDVENSFEYPAFKTIYQEAFNDNIKHKLDETLFIYFHTKGITTGDKKLRPRLFNYMIKNHKRYTKEFINNPQLDVASLCPDKKGFGWYNFFWVRASYVKNYWVDPSKYRSLKWKDRYLWEIFNGCDYATKPEKDIVVWSPATGYDKMDRKIIKDPRVQDKALSGLTDRV